MAGRIETGLHLVLRAVRDVARDRTAAEEADTQIMSTDPFELVLSHAHDVQRQGHDKAVARACPDSKHRNVSIARGADGRVLLKSWTGRSVEELCSLWGLTVGDLFPPRPRDLNPQEQAAMRQAAKQAGWSAALGVLSREALVVAIAAGYVEDGEALTSDDRGRLTLAIRRIDDAKAVLCA